MLNFDDKYDRSMIDITYERNAIMPQDRISYNGKIPKGEEELYGSPRARELRAFYNKKGSGGNFDYNGLDSINGSHLNINGANPGDIIFSDPYHPKGEPTIHGMRLPPQPNQENAFNPNGANPEDVLKINTQKHKFSHFAVFPTTLVEPLIKAGCPRDGIVLDPFGW